MINNGIRTSSSRAGEINPIHISTHADVTVAGVSVGAGADRVNGRSNTTLSPSSSSSSPSSNLVLDELVNKLLRINQRRIRRW